MDLKKVELPITPCSDVKITIISLKKWSPIVHLIFMKYDFISLNVFCLVISDP